MASKEGNKITVGTGTWYVGLTVVEQSSTATDVTFRCTLKVHSNYGLNVDYNTARIKAGSSSGASGYGIWEDKSHSINVSYAGGNSPVTIKTWDVKVAKGNDSKKVYFTGSYYLCSVLTGTSTASLTMSVPALVADAHTSCTNTRVSDSKNTVAWTRGANADAAYYSQSVERSVDGGAWSKIASVDASATSYTDTATSANHSYRYRVRAYNSSGYTVYVTSGTTYNTPAAPTSLTAVRGSETTVLLTIENPANTATHLHLERSTNGSSWAAVKTVEGSPVVEVADETDGGTYYYRARNSWNQELMSDWSPMSNSVATLCAPNAPTITNPSSGAVVNKADGFVFVSWTHNTVDGSAQTQAQIEYDLGGGYAIDTVFGDNSFHTIEGDLPLNGTLTFRVRTRGAHDSWSPWSESRVCYIKAAPTVYFSEPSDGFRVGQMPLAVNVSYSDESGVLANSTLVIQHNGATVYTRNMGKKPQAVIEASEWLPENGQTYTLRVDVRSSSTLSAYATREIVTDFTPPMLGTVIATPDPETGYVNLLLGVVEDGSLEEVANLAVWRVTKNGEVPIGSELHAGSGITDMYAPLNTDYSYKVASFAESGALSTNYVPARLDTPYWFIYHQDGVAKGMWEPSDEITAGKPNDELVYLDNREWPVLLQTVNKSYERNVSGWVETQEDVSAFEAVNFAKGGCVFKSLRGGDVFHCIASAQIDLDMEYLEDGANVSVSITRIDGGDL